MITCESDASLNIDLTRMLGYDFSVNIRPWNEGISWSSTSAEETTFHDYSAELPVTFALLKREKNANPWLDLLPQDIRSALDTYDEKYSNVLFSTLWFISRGRHAYEYFLNQPRIVWFMLQHAKLYKWPELYVASLFSEKRRTILEACGLPGNKSCLNFLAKFSSESYGPRQFKFIRGALNTADYRRVTHLKFVDEHIFDFMQKHQELPWSNLLIHYDGHWNLTSLNSIINDIVRIAQDTGCPNILNRICKFKNLTQINRLHDDLVDKTNQRMIDTIPDIHYPSPPIPGNDDIVPVSNKKDLVTEGIDRHHCISSYHDRILAGDYYVYRISHPESATLGITKTQNKLWKIDEIKTKFNGKPSDETTKTVYSWFSEACRDCNNIKMKESDNATRAF